MKTKHLIYEMLTENTGRHMLDSGGAYGRNWERNQKKTIQDFQNEEEELITFDGDYIERTVSVFHYLSQLELDEIIEELEYWNQIDGDQIIKHPYKDKEYKVKEVLEILNQEA